MPDKEKAHHRHWRALIDGLGNFLSRWRKAEGEERDQLTAQLALPEAVQSQPPAVEKEKVAPEAPTLDVDEAVEYVKSVLSHMPSVAIDLSSQAKAMAGICDSGLPGQMVQDWPKGILLYLAERLSVNRERPLNQIKIRGVFEIDIAASSGRLTTSSSCRWGTAK